MYEKNSIHINENMKQAIVSGRSMENIFEMGDYVICAQTNEKYRCGDIVLICFDNLVVIHRILKVRKNVFLEGGDNGISVYWHDCSAIIGRARFLCRKNEFYIIERNIYSYLNGLFTRLFCFLNKKLKLHTKGIRGVKKSLINILLIIRKVLQRKQLSK